MATVQLRGFVDNKAHEQSELAEGLECLNMYGAPGMADLLVRNLESTFDERSLSFCKFPLCCVLRDGHFSYSQHPSKDECQGPQTGTAFWKNPTATRVSRDASARLHALDATSLCKALESTFLFPGTIFGRISAKFVCVSRWPMLRQDFDKLEYQTQDFILLHVIAQNTLTEYMYTNVLSDPNIGCGLMSLGSLMPVKSFPGFYTPRNPTRITRV
ncbi:hypothetical protein DFS34DRAFT_590267 [Phlyctochytrium arcticum]|nr:hypothetical protein DFS34DRAFT_590267 [Phlyctochytrium arcticum]